MSLGARWETFLTLLSSSLMETHWPGSHEGPGMGEDCVYIPQVPRTGH